MFIWSQLFALVSWDVARLGDVNADGLADFGIWDNAHNYEVLVVHGVPVRDIDGDGFPTPADCDDGQVSIHPGAPEAGTGEDFNCDGLIQCLDDLDGDGWGRNNGAVVPVGQSCGPGSTTRLGDCDDHNPAMWPGAADPPGDQVDGDCDGLLSCSLDIDGDGFGAAAGVEISGGNCSADARYVLNASDCDDNDLHVRPGAAEVGGNEVDEDCDGQLACAVDDDGDGWGDPTHFVMAPACAWPADDCDDTDPASFPAAPEVTGDMFDQNCDGQYACWLDADFDGWGDATSVVQRPTTCGTLDGSPYSTDCDDEDPSVHPTAFEAPGLDSDCDGSALCGLDLDGDGYGDPNHRGWTTDLPCLDERDCDDHDFTVHPFAASIFGDGLDQDCDGLDECLLDSDGDGFGRGQYAPAGCEGPEASPIGGDCDDDVSWIHPLAEEIPGNDYDEDCDNQIDCFVDHDQDGWGSDTVLSIDSFFGYCYGVARGDCNDANNAVFPGNADSRGNGVDESCDGQDGLGMALFRQPEADWVMVGGAHARGRIYVALSTTGLGAGPCPPALGGQCLGLRAPRLLAVVAANADGAAWLDATTAAWLNPNGTTWLQAVEVGGSVVVTRPIAIPPP